VPPTLDLAFDSGTLHVLRVEVLTHVCRAGWPEGRAGEVVLAVHELAANVIMHGWGEGRLRLWSVVGGLLCQVDDGDPPASGDGVAPDSLPSVPGHGLWVVAQIADKVHTLSGPHGTSVTVTFGVPADD
jgi:anti-sigma regulatory factor (Ser/Thr protein kinase)